MKYRLIMKDIPTILKVRRIQPGGEVQKFIDSEVLRLSDAYVPFRTGVLKGSGIRHTNIGSGEVRYKTPYARSVYYSKNKKFTGAPVRGSFWFERMKADHKDTILRGAAKIAGGRAEK